ncbi:MAG: hypothetical protein K8I00_07805 [Candidatus Omnitrophica bacterium]|nr:hypothetical protein [Candidatus Omnitrophota bacterium]
MLKYTIVLIIIVTAVVAIKSKIRFAPTYQVRIKDIPDVYAKLEAGGQDSSFATFSFIPPDKQSPDEAINIQFSIAEGRIGLDWVLLAPANIRDKDRIQGFVQERGYVISKRSMNDVHYLRVEGGADLPKLCQEIIRDVYRVSADEELGLDMDGFQWPESEAK